MQGKIAREIVKVLKTARQHGSFDGRSTAQAQECLARCAIACDAFAIGVIRGFILAA